MPTPRREEKRIIGDGFRDAQTCCMQRVFVGLILGVSAEVVTQKVNRHGDSVQHATCALSRKVSEGEIVSIKYVNGVGIVGGKGPDEIGMTKVREMGR